ncbi:sigma-54-dependent transcriptional regulator [Piscinibacter koreensis]|uniref:Sigma-54-dependent Fis family transcriptional regulator n=1 Tax=Piscinibacter koreensis TaxID=2742824 RepID=A0A7Y6NM74_9BURK|nr:sigma-54 dependent transcriptional regulator [Schlegelella koreensis]NUZ05696.1 sigma-54-dependent Fis family transcriptional regulator [Schlegelella koreensis]
MATASSFTLLIVDDEPDLRTLYELTLLREGYELDTAGSVQDALEHLAERSYSAVITDMRLPDGSGLDLLRWLEDRSRREKTIVITAYGSAENAVEALKAGAYDYLTKPVDLKQFRAVIASALGRGGGAPTPPAAGSLPSNGGGGSAGGNGGGASAGGAGAGSNGGHPGTGGSAAAARTAEAAAPSRARPVSASPASQALERMAGQSAAMKQVRSLVEKVARSMAPVLISGESGTGKELVARAIHAVSVRHAQPFVAVNCGAIPEQLLEAEFFGYRKGAFTGAADDREGFFQAASGGTLFLDEIGDLPLSMQSKLLRAIQERSVRPVGAVAETPVDVRLLSATHKDLGAEVQAGQFRQDLYYRLNVIQIRVPPLRERLEDLVAVSERVLERLSRDAGVWPPPRLTPAALAQLARHSFPGNVRELENLLHRAVALSGGDEIDADDLGLGELDGAGDSAPGSLPVSPAIEAEDVPASFAMAREPLPNDLAKYLDDVERDILVRALEQHRFNRTAAGASLGLSLRQMRYRMARLGVTAGSDT